MSVIEVRVVAQCGVAGAVQDALAWNLVVMLPGPRERTPSLVRIDSCGLIVDRLAKETISGRHAPTGRGWSPGPGACVAASFPG